jgi:Group XII secretory phospholipase A2 precursor (PLA2G12)
MRSAIFLTLSISAIIGVRSTPTFGLSAPGKHPQKRDTCSASAALGCPGATLVNLFPSFPPPVNGCGPEGADFVHSILDTTDTTPCCNAHDACYSDCGSTFEGCNEQLRQCIVQLCEEHRPFNTGTCADLGWMIYNKVTDYCYLYIPSIEQSCYCP